MVDLIAWDSLTDSSFMFPLRLHSDYSLLKAMVPVERYIDALKAHGYTGGAITDFGCGFGWVDFGTQMKKAGLKPILGTTFDFSFLKKEKTKGQISLLVLNTAGYRNLNLILSAYSLGTLSLERLFELQEGIVMMISPDHPELSHSALEAALKAWNPQNLYIQIYRYEGAPDESAAVAASEKLKIKCVATQPVYFLKEEDFHAHEVLLSIGAQTTLEDESRPQLPSKDFYLKSNAEFSAIFRDRPEWIEATNEIASRVDFVFDTGTYHIPKFADESGQIVKDADARLYKECLKGLEERLELVRTFTPPEKFAEVEKIYRDRLEEEYQIICKMRFSDYFLVVADFIQWSKRNNIPVGPGRGSGAGSLAAYCLQIVDIDPVRYNLLFERFLNPERVSMPDFDVDFCVKGRDRVIEYVRKKYNLNEEGKTLEENLKVAQIITYGKMKSKAVIRDVGRALGIPYQDVDAIAKLIPNVLNITLLEAFEKEPEFANLRARDPKADELLKIAERLEGLNRHSSVHAAGVVIADDLLTQYVPLYKGSDQEIVSQYEMKGIEKLGLLKFDFLGLRNLTVIQESIQITGKDINLLKIDYNDPRVMAELSSGDTVGIFQLESSGMRDVIRRLKPSCLEDIIAIVALYRPGPLEGGMVDDFILRKQGKKPVSYDSPVLQPILKETYGVFVYQEQVMKTANVMAGFSLGEADLLRRAMGKKIASEMALQREKFVEGAKKNGHPESLAQKIFDLMSEFAKYGFNKSHAAAYAMVTVQTAYMKTYYPEAFFAALLSSESEDTEKMGLIIRSALNRGIEILPPHVNFSESDFAPEEHEGKLGVRFGLSAIKNLGQNVAAAIVEERKRKGPFQNAEEFFKRLPLDLLNKRQAECLIRSGALDGLGHPTPQTRATLFASLDTLLSTAQAEGRARVGGQKTLFASKPKIKVVEEWSEKIRLNDEKHLLGAYMTGHPLESFRLMLKMFKTASIQDLHDSPHVSSKDVETSIAGLVVSSKEIFTKKGTKMAFCSIEDLDGVMEIVVFSDLYARKGSLIVNDRILLVKGQVVRENDVTRILARDLHELTQTEYAEIHIKVPSRDRIASLKDFPQIASKFPGAVKVKVHLPMAAQVAGATTTNSSVTIDSPLQVQVHPQLINWLEREFGAESIQLR